MFQLARLKNYINFGPRQAFGVDLNNDSIKILQLVRAGKGIHVSGWKRIKLPKGVVDYYEIRDEKKFQETFLAGIKDAQGKIKGREVVVSLPENKVFTRIISVPLMNPEEAGETIKWETESNIPISIEEVYFDWQIVAKEKSTMKVLVMACPRKIIENYLSAFNGVGYNVVAFEAESIATGRSVIQDKDGSSTLIVDLGGESTSYAIYEKGYPVFTSSGSISGELITDTISKKLGLDEEKAESYKIKTGLGDDNFEKGELFDALSPLVSSLVTELEKTISFFDENLRTDKNKDLEKIILCGGGSNLKGLAPYLAINLKRDVVQSNPWININLGNTPPISKELSQGFSTVLGLAIRAKDYENYA